MGINTNIPTMGLYKNTCTKCNVPTFYDPSKSSSSEYIMGPFDTQNYVFDYMTSLMVETTVTDELWKDDFYVQLYKYSREMNFTVEYGLGTSASVNFDSDFDGYIGIQPWKANEGLKEYNFMWQL